MTMKTFEEVRIGVVGLGYVGLPLAIEFGKRFPVTGYDINASRIEELQQGQDRTLEVDPDTLKAAVNLVYSADPQSLQECNVYIMTVPTPVDNARKPDFDPLLQASAAIGSLLKAGDIVVYESTVYPGVTEEVCAPVLERASGLKFNQDFFCGYSPERINPGDKGRQLTAIVKVTSGSTPEVARFVDELYAEIIEAGTHRASSIRVAEAAKVIENTQRDVNIALMNELARIFGRIGIDTHEVLAAARTKWNFMPFVPGLVGGHCIGVDPYYLVHKAAILGYNPELILAARRINDEMGPYVAARLIQAMAKARINIVDARVLVLGLAFKENCPDLRNTKVVDVIRELEAVNANVEVFDPWIDPGEARREFDIEPVSDLEPGSYDAVVLAVAHRQFIAPDAGIDALRLVRDGGIVFDIKGQLPRAPEVHRI